jgi:hypothetical protein
MFDLLWSYPISRKDVKEINWYATIEKKKGSTEECPKWKN